MRKKIYKRAVNALYGYTSDANGIRHAGDIGGQIVIQSVVHIALVVKDYDEAIESYTKKLNFTLVEDTYQPEQDKRWVVVSPPGSNGTTILLARASKPEQEPFVGNQAGGRVFLFLGTDDFWRDYNEMKKIGIEFVRSPKEQDYGIERTNNFLKS